MTTIKIVPKSVKVCVAESEVGQYCEAGVTVLAHPDEVIGIGPLRNWVLDACGSKPVVMLDDDLIGLLVNVGATGRKLTAPDEIMAVLEGTLRCAMDAKVGAFGWAQTWDVRHYRGNDPFGMTGWVGGAIGVIGRDIRFDNAKLLKADVDFCLHQLWRKRILWIDRRYSFIQGRSTSRAGGGPLLGGNTKHRSADRVERELDALTSRWGRHFRYRRGKAGERLSLDVPRRQQMGLNDVVD